MEIFIYLREYRVFMEWFRKYYPRLFQLHRDHITYPTDNMGISINKENISLPVYQKLANVRLEFYRVAANTASW